MRIKPPDSDTIVRSFLQDPSCNRHRFLDARWWYLNLDSYWIKDVGNIYINRAIRNTVIGDLGHAPGLNAYLYSRLRTLLAGYLSSQKLPGRLEQSDPVTHP